MRQQKTATQGESKRFIYKPFIQNEFSVCSFFESG